MHREHHIVTISLGADVDRGAARRILGRVVYDLHEGLLDQHRVDIDERQVRVHVERHLVLRQPPVAALERRVDNVSRLDPFELRLDLVTADPGCVQEILNVVVEPLGLVAHDARERVQPLILRDRRRAAQDGRGAHDRGERCAQLVRYRADQRLA